MRIAVLPFDVRVDACDDNLAVVEAGLRAAAREGVALVVLPEMWPTSFPVAETDVDAATIANARAVEHVRACSRDLDLVVAGSALHAREHARPTNRWHLIERGEIVASHDKIHLFTPTAEDASFSAGDAPLLIGQRVLVKFMKAGQTAGAARTPSVGVPATRSMQTPEPRPAGCRRTGHARRQKPRPTAGAFS